MRIGSRGALGLGLWLSLVGCGGTHQEGPRGPLLFTMAHEAPAAQGAQKPVDDAHGTILGPEKSAIPLERLSRMPEPGWSVPRRPGYSPDGKLVTYLASESGDNNLALFAFDPATRASRVLLRASDLPGSTRPISREEELRRERQRQRSVGIVSYAWARKANVMLIPSGGEVFVRGADGKIARLTETDEPELDPQICDNGERVAYVRGRELFVMDVATRKETRLTEGAPEGVTRGQSDFLAQEEFDEPSGFFWSPGCDRIAYLEVDERGVGEAPVLGYRGGQADLMMQRYPLPGAANPKVRAGIVDLKTKKTTWLKWPAEGERYMARFQWAPDGGALFAQALTRDQKRLALVRVDPKSGEAKELVTESSTTWVDFAGMTLLERSPRFLWTTAKDGHTHLELRDAATGALVKPLTAGAWDVAGVGRVDEAGGRVFLTANKDAPLDRQLYSVPLEGGEVRRWTEEPGVHMTGVDRGARLMVDMHSALDRPPRVVIRELGGSALGELPVPPDPDLEKLGLRKPEIVPVQAAGGETLYGELLPPRNIEPGKRYPVVVMVYGGPGVQTVLNAWGPKLLWQHLADRGFVVFAIDNRGTSGRGPAFASNLHLKAGDIELTDQIAGLDAIGKLPYVDTSRVGIYGHSYGGFMATLALLKAPDRFHVGVAGAPVTDWRLYDSAYTERYLGTPKENAAAYDTADLTKLAGNLRGKLFLIHALMDENVHFQNSAQLIDALVAANKRFDLLVLPGERHGFRAPAARRYVTERVIDYLIENLK
jgi:dipeptidyl-peptidase-4